MSKRLRVYLSSFEGLLLDAAEVLQHGTDPGLSIEVNNFITVHPGAAFMPAKFVVYDQEQPLRKAA